MKNNKTALITGAASGLGFEFSLLLAQDFYKLVLVDIDKSKLENAKNYIESKYDVNVTVLVKDLSKINVSQEIFEDLKGVQIDVLINNAGFGLFGAFSNTNWNRESKMLNLHISTLTQLTKLALRQMLIQGSGRILNVASLAAFQPGPLMSVYYASKAYVLSFSEALSNELSDTGVTVTALCPGQTKTSFQEVVSVAASSKNKLKFNMASAKEVAEYGYMAMLKGKTVAIPGFLNTLLSKIPRFFSRSLVTSIVRKIQEKNRVEKVLVKSFNQ